MYFLKSIPRLRSIYNDLVPIKNEADVLFALVLVGLMGPITRGKYHRLYVDGKPWKWVRAEAHMRIRAIGFKVSKRTLDTVIKNLEITGGGYGDNISL